MTPAPARDAGLDWLRVLGALQVVLGHAWVLGTPSGPPAGALTRVTFHYFGSLALGGAGLFAMVLGALALTPERSVRPMTSAVRARRLLWPWLFWSAVYSLAGLAFPPPYWQPAGQLGRLCWSWYVGAPVAPLWFLWAAFGLSALAQPIRSVLEACDRKRRRALLAATLAAGIALELHWTFVESWTLPFFLQWLRLIGLFLLGAELYATPPRRLGAAWFVVLGLAAVALHALTRHLVFDLDWGGWPEASELRRTGDWKLNFLSPARLLLNVSLFVLVCRAAPRLPRLPAPLAELTFGIYLTHTLWLDFVFPRLGLVATQLPPQWLFAVVALTLLASALTTLLLRQLPGGRSLC